MTTSVNLFRRVAMVEGISYIVLLFIAMPLKYFFSMPKFVTYVGWAHGVLFMAYLVCLLLCWVTYRWTFGRVVWFFIASLLPFLPFFVEKSLRKEYPTS